MRNSPELIIFDDSEDRTVLEYAREAALRHGVTPGIFLDAEKAADAAGLYTRGIITSLGNRSFRANSFTGLNPISVSDVLEIPRAVILEGSVRASEVTREGMPDIVIPRDQPRSALQLVGVWLDTIKPKK